MQSHLFTFGVPVKDRLWDQVLVTSDTTASRVPIPSAWQMVQSVTTSTTWLMCVALMTAVAEYPGWQVLQSVWFGCVPPGGLPWQLVQVIVEEPGVKVPVQLVSPAGAAAAVVTCWGGVEFGPEPPALVAFTR